MCRQERVILLGRCNAHLEISIVVQDVNPPVPAYFSDGPFEVALGDGIEKRFHSDVDEEAHKYTT